MRANVSLQKETSYSPVKHMKQSARPQRDLLYPLRQESIGSPTDDTTHMQTEAKHQIRPPQTFQQQLDLAFGAQDQATARAIEQEEDAKEVYIYNCCGVSRELNPSIEFMPTFRALFFLFNFFVFIFGLANFGMGLWFRIDPKVYEIHKYIETQNFTIAGWVLLFCGFLACIVAFIGFASAVRQAVGLLMFYFIIMIPLTLAFVGTLVLLTVFGFGLSLERFLTKEIYEQIRRRSMSTDTDLFASDDAAQFLDFIQVKMRCCGAHDFRDYGKLGMVVPTTCYTIDKNYVSAPGCGNAIRKLFDLRAGLAAGFTSGSVISQLTAAIVAALMFCSIYHWRANSRPLTPSTDPNEATHTINRRSPAPHHEHLYLQQRPRSRTPIII